MKFKKLFSFLLTVILFITTVLLYEPRVYAADTPIIKDCYPSKAMVYQSGQTFSLRVGAKKGSTVTAKFRGKTVTLKPGKKTTEYIDYYASFTLSSYKKGDTDLGKIVFTATYKGKSESIKSGNITAKKLVVPKKSDPSVTPKGGKYIDVGSGRIAEIVAYEAETFNPRSTNDYSRPTNNYLPKGTVDYCSQTYYYNNTGDYKKKYVLMRYGRQVYSYRKDTPDRKHIPITKEYIGELPDHNEIDLKYIKNGTTHTTLVVGSMWKAPFYFDIKPQSYKNPSVQNYTITDFTAEYIDITFCYATVLKNSLTIPKDNPIFKSSKIITNLSNGKIIDYTLRLYLKKTGGFYGWDCHYAPDGSLIFKFLNPHQVAKANNIYGVDLKGARILIDVGHGGKDGGAAHFSNANREAVRNLILAKKIKTELESIGAVVFMTRTTDTVSTNDDKIKQLKNLKPDYCISIHHNSSTASSANGFGVYYTHPFTKEAANLVNYYTNQTNIYKKAQLKGHFYYMSRSSYCPVVLTENGFLSNKSDYNKITDNWTNTRKARAITKGIAMYFGSIINVGVAQVEPTKKN